MNGQISPNYSHNKLENPNFSDLVDVFEDMWEGYIFSPVWILLNSPNCDIAAMTLLCSYFESIAIYLSGEDSCRRSKDFFVNGFSVVFHCDTADIEYAAQEIYKHIRCGLAHEGMLSHKVNYSRDGAKAFFITYPKNTDGVLNIDAGISSIMLNPLRVYEAVMLHFKNYLVRLRTSNEVELCQAFQKSAERLWGLNEGENVIGMTEDEFLGVKII